MQTRSTTTPLTSNAKYVEHPSPLKLSAEQPQPVERLHGDIYGLINPLSSQFAYFLVLVNASHSHAQILLLTTRNIALSKILALLIKFKTHFLDKPIKTLRIDNAKGFRFHAFEDYCTTTKIALT